MRLRDEPFNQMYVVNDKNGNVTSKDNIKKRWQEYFQELLNPARDEGNDT